MRVQIVSFNCVLKNNLGQFISSSFNQEIATTPDPDQAAMLPGLVQALQRLKKGERETIRLKATEAYGWYQPDLCVTVPRKDLPQSRKWTLGQAVQLTPMGESKPRTYRVTHLDSVNVTVDGNHPLAGQDLIFDLHVLDSRTEADVPLANAQINHSI